MPSPSDCRFTDSHEWFRLDGDIVTMGITQYAADELTDLTYVEIKPVGSMIDAGEMLGEVESVKTTSDVFSPLGGEIIEINDAASSDPSLLNSDPFGEGWLARLRVADTAILDGLMDQATYDEKYPLES